MDKCLKKFLRDSAFAIAKDDKDILSLNIVGSFRDKNDLSGISDIDTVIIVDHLTEWVFKRIVKKFETIGVALKEHFGYRLKLNTTFGPLKYNEDQLVVYHLMIYDRAGHVDHCRKSPFTCYNWQATDLFCKQHISDFYKVRTLMPHFFFNARRGVKDYLKDYCKGVISFRSYEFEDGRAYEKKHEKPMEIKDRYEFVFHIMRFIIHNFMKMIAQDNLDYDKESITNSFVELFPKLEPLVKKKFPELEKIKQSNQFSSVSIDLKELDHLIHYFLNEFEKGFQEYFSAKGSIVSFIRHGKTHLNQGSIFLGQKLDPPILPVESFEGIKRDQVYSSPSQRSQETACLLVTKSEIQISELLKEIDYGKVEGLGYSKLLHNFPELIDAWNRGEDPQFPNGESTRDVYHRVKKFLNKILAENKKDYSLLVVTHNVWLRCLVGSSLGISLRDWFLIEIPHLKEIRFLKNPKGGLVPDFTIDDQVLFLRKVEKQELLNSFQTKDIKQREKSWAKIHSCQLKPHKKKSLEGSCLIPMAGDGRRFSEHGFAKRKPMIKVEKDKMIDQVLDCLPEMEKYIFLVREDNLPLSFKNSGFESDIVPVKTLTEGQASTCMLGLEKAASENPLLIAPCDNGMYWDYEKFQEIISSGADLICWTFSKNLVISDSPKSWGYVTINHQNDIMDVSVKKPFTSEPFNEQCIIGTFWFKKTSLFAELYKILVERNLRVNGEFYVDSMLKVAIDEGLKVKNFEVDHYISWGKPQDLFEYRKWKDLQSLYS